MVTGVHDGQVGHADAPAATGTGTTGDDAAGTGTTGTSGVLVEPAWTGTGTTGTTGVEGEGVARTGGVTGVVEAAPASMGLGDDTNGTGTTDGVL